jgi:hypothetical protein
MAMERSAEDVDRSILERKVKEVTPYTWMQPDENKFVPIQLQNS